MRKLKITTRLLLMVGLVSMLGACSSPVGGTTDAPDLSGVSVEGNYTNTSGSNPEFVIDAQTVPESVSLDTVPIVSLDGDNVHVSINNVSVISGGQNYYIHDVEVEEYVNSEWRSYVEYSSSVTELTDIAIVLVLDVSDSLGSDFFSVKEYAKEFVSIVKSNSPNALISVVDFATDVNSIPLQSSASAVDSYIDSLEQGQYTSLYDAMYRASQILDGRVFPSTTENFTPASSPTLSWPEVTGSDGYHVQIGTSDTFGNGLLVDDTTIAPDVTEFGIPADMLSDGTTYYWRFRSDAGAGDWGNWNGTYQFNVKSSVEGKAMVTFTDGEDSASDIINPEPVISELQDSTVKSFTIGLEGRGGVDDRILTELAVNGSYAQVDTASELQDVFRSFSEAVSNVYRLNYKRHAQVITDPRKVRFNISASLDPLGNLTSFVFYTGSYPEQCSWKVVDENGVTVAEGSGYEDDRVTRESTANLPPGTYTVEGSASWDEGWYGAHLTIVHRDQTLLDEWTFYSGYSRTTDITIP